MAEQIVAFGKDFFCSLIWLLAINYSSISTVLLRVQNSKYLMTKMQPIPYSATIISIYHSH
ncbi:MAG: hypothetical protein HC903_03240 [Methylacidiphilales bacterium]|nr:hypothetical protein [Candidatus Methylacidiphilales bacterium]